MYFHTRKRSRHKQHPFKYIEISMKLISVCINYKALKRSSYTITITITRIHIESLMSKLKSAPLNNQKPEGYKQDDDDSKYLSEKHRAGHFHLLNENVVCGEIYLLNETVIC